MSKKQTIPPCPYCANPDLFNAQSEQGGRALVGGIVNMRGKYWQRPSNRHASLRTFPEFIYKEQRRFRIEGKKEFIKRFQGFNVEVIGLELVIMPIMSEGPGFHQAMPAGFDRMTNEERVKTPLRFYNACRITHEKTQIVLDAHAWSTHGLLMTFRNLPTSPTKETEAVLRLLLDFFKAETRGAPKVLEYEVIKAIQKLGEKATQDAVAKELAVSKRTLRDWTARHGMNWQAAKQKYENARI
jgi:DNA-binding transcriptional regulator YiaG